MYTRRRQFFKLTCAFLAAGCSTLLRPISAMAAEWNKKGFEARSLATVLKSLNAGSPASSKSIQVKLPEIADDDSDVPIYVASKISNTQMIAIIVENNIQPLAASFAFSGGADPAFSAHLRIRRTSQIKILVQADGKYFLAAKEVKITSAESCS